LCTTGARPDALRCAPVPSPEAALEVVVDSDAPATTPARSRIVVVVPRTPEDGTVVAVRLLVVGREVFGAVVPATPMPVPGGALVVGGPDAGGAVVVVVGGVGGYTDAKLTNAGAVPGPQRQASTLPSVTAVEPAPACE